MTGQIPLQFADRLVYRPSDFFLHQGVLPAFAECKSLGRGPGPWVRWIVGPRRSGKSHFAIRVRDELHRAGRFVHLLGGENWIADARARAERIRPANDEVWIIDDADADLAGRGPGESGPFVELMEAWRGRRAGAVLLSSRTRDELPCDDHAGSRIVSASGLVLGKLGEADLSSVIGLLSRQRGLVLSRTQILFVARRLSRDMAVIEEFVERVGHLALVSGRAIHRELLADVLQTQPGTTAAQVD